MEPTAGAVKAADQIRQHFRDASKWREFVTDEGGIVFKRRDSHHDVTIWADWDGDIYGLDVDGDTNPAWDGTPKEVVEHVESWWRD